MRILLFGSNGQVGWELQRALAPVGELVAPVRGGTLHADFGQPQALRETAQRVTPDVIVNAAAYTAVDRAESEPELAHTVNAIAPGVLAEEAAVADSWLVHYSTDYVFDGSGNEPWRESSPTGPLNVYGESKLAGERAIRASGCHHLIMRTSWVYATRGKSFATTMLRLAQELESLKVVDDQVGTPDRGRPDRRRDGAHPADGGGLPGRARWDVPSGCRRRNKLARVCASSAAARRRARRSPAGQRGRRSPVSTAAYPTAARRPAKSRLDTRQLRERFGPVLPAWQHGVFRMVDELVQP